MVQVVGALSNESLCSLKLPGSSKVLDVKRHVQATLGINVFRQRLIISPAGPQVEDHEVLATLPGLRLQLVKLEYTDDNEDEEGRLLRAADRGVVREVEQLLRLPLRPDCMRAEAGRTALIRASVGGHLEVVQLLCDAGADKDKVCVNGFTALMWASSLEVARLLCEAGADKDKANRCGFTALMWASSRGRLEVVRLLCEAGADTDKANQGGATALIRASSHGHLEVVRLLLAGAEKDKANENGTCKRAPGGGATALRGRGRQGQGGPERYHGLDVCVHPRSPEGGATAL